MISVSEREIIDQMLLATESLMARATDESARIGADSITDDLIDAVEFLREVVTDVVAKVYDD